jgi:predicted DNA-binding protein YlxM (UPF0122 family)
MRQALMRLGRRQRTTVVLRHLYDMNLQEIADHMGCSVETVKSQLSRGLQTLARPWNPTAGSLPDTSDRKRTDMHDLETEQQLSAELHAADWSLAIHPRGPKTSS